MNKLLIATTNPAKVKEYHEFLSEFPFKLVSLSDISITEKARENGKTLEENAIIKAEFYGKLAKLPAIADDGGFEIDALDGEPGVYSHRWKNKNKEDTDEEIIEYALERLKDVPMERRGAQLRLVTALYIPQAGTFTESGVVTGMIPEKACEKREAGFPYRSLLYIPEVNKYYTELNTQEHEQYNHRKQAILKLKPIINKHLTS